jgi:hypothetical protein
MIFFQPNEVFFIIIQNLNTTKLRISKIITIRDQIKVRYFTSKNVKVFFLFFKYLLLL